MQLLVPLNNQEDLNYAVQLLEQSEQRCNTLCLFLSIVGGGQQSHLAGEFALFQLRG